MQAHVGQRDASSLQQQSAAALKNLPFNAAWMTQLKSRIAGDPVYAKGRAFFDSTPVWGAEDGGYGQQMGQATQAHLYVRQHVKEYDQGYRLPPSGYWPRFNEAFYVMEEERKELGRIAGDGNAIAAVQHIAQFKVTPQIQATYQILASEYATTTDDDRFFQQKRELVQIAQQEQLNILQPLIYADIKLIATMDLNHTASHWTNGWISRKYAVIFSAAPTTDDPNLRAVFDDKEWSAGTSKSLPNPNDRMEYVGQIAKQFNSLMSKQRSYMEQQLRIIHGWMNA